MANLVTLGSPHQGVYGLPRCLGDDVKLCDYVRALLNHGAYKKYDSYLIFHIILNKKKELSMIRCYLFMQMDSKLCNTSRILAWSTWWRDLQTCKCIFSWYQQWKGTDNSIYVTNGNLLRSVFKGNQWNLQGEPTAVEKFCSCEIH